MSDEPTTSQATDNPTDHAHAGGGQTAETGDSGGFKAITSETELAAWKSETRKAIVAEVRKTLKAEADKAADDERQQRERDEQVKRGEFDQARTALEKARDDAKATADRLQTENDAYREAMATGVEAGWKELPEAVRKVGEKQHDETDVLGRWRFLNDPDTRALVKAIAPADQNGRRGNGPDPRPAGAAKPNDDDAKRGAAAIIRGAF